MGGDLAVLELLLLLLLTRSGDCGVPTTPLSEVFSFNGMEGACPDAAATPSVVVCGVVVVVTNNDVFPDVADDDGGDNPPSP